MCIRERLASILVKVWLYTYNHAYGKRLHSSLLEATAADSLSDVLGTSAVLLSTILSPVLKFNLDGYMGMIVAAFILYTGISLIRSALDDLLGKAPDPELVQEIYERIKTVSYTHLRGHQRTRTIARMRS